MHVLDKHIRVLALEALEAFFESIGRQLLRRVDIKGAVDHIRDRILTPAPKECKRRVVVDEGRAGEADAVKVEDDVDRVDRA